MTRKYILILFTALFFSNSVMPNEPFYKTFLGKVIIGSFSSAIATSAIAGSLRPIRIVRPNYIFNIRNIKRAIALISYTSATFGITGLLGLVSQKKYSSIISLIAIAGAGIAFKSTLNQMKFNFFEG